MATLSLKKMQRSLESAKRNSQRMRAKAREGVETVLRTGEVCGTSLLFGVVKGRTGDTPSVAGVPLDLGLGLAGHGMAIMGIGGGMEGHLRGFADGCLASFSHTQGVAIGANMAARAGTAPATSGEEGVSGYLDATDDEMAGGYGLTEEDLAAYGL